MISKMKEAYKKYKSYVAVDLLMYILLIVGIVLFLVIRVLVK